MSSDATLLVTLLREILPILIAELRSDDLRNLEDDAAVTLALDRAAAKAEALRDP